MATVSSTDIAFEGFRLAREKPTAIAAWAVVYFVLSMLTALVLVTIAGEALTDLRNAGSGSDQDPQAAMAQFGQLAWIYVALVPLLLVFYGILYAAVHRAVLRPSDGGFGFLKLGPDELRQAAVMFLYTLIIVVAAVVSAVLVGVVAGAATAANAGLGVLLAILLSLGMIALCLWLGVRLSLASPMTFAERRIRLLGSWALTRGRFWPLLGGYLLAVMVAIVVSILGLVIFSAVAAIVGGGLSAVGQVFSPDYSSVGAYFSVAMIVYLVVSSVLSALTIAITVGASSEAYRQITGGSPDASADVFA